MRRSSTTMSGCLTTYIRQVVDGQVDDVTYAAMEGRLGTRGLFEYTGFILWLHWTIRMEQWVKLPAPTDAEVEELIAALRTATRAAMTTPAGSREVSGASRANVRRPAGYR